MQNLERPHRQDCEAGLPEEFRLPEYFGMRLGRKDDGTDGQTAVGAAWAVRIPSASRPVGEGLSTGIPI